MNNELHVVNFNYPYRPYKIYNGHTEQVTAILFKDKKYLITCSKGSIYFNPKSIFLFEA